MTRVPRVIALAVAALAAPAVLIGMTVPAASAASLSPRAAVAPAAVTPAVTVLNALFTGQGPTEVAAYSSALSKMEAAHCSYEQEVSALHSGSNWTVTLEGSCIVG
jgi:hypothetical protein